ncbi:MAG: membrane protein insertion efficiency factor YidD [Caulobacterales bacterium]
MAQRWPSRFVIGVIRLYKATASPALSLLSRCRHLPSCADFTCDAVARHGAWAGGWMGLARICRCRPGGSWGYDPAPQARSEARWYAPWGYGDWRGGYRPPPEEQP